MAYESCNKCFNSKWLMNDLKSDLKIAVQSKNKELSQFANKLLNDIGEYENGSSNFTKTSR